MKDYKQYQEDLNPNESTFFDYDEDDDEECNGDITKVLDSELIEYFNDARVIPSKKNNLFKTKKKKRDKIIFEMDQKVKVNGTKCIVLYGPFEKDNKQYYELETEAGNVIRAEYNQIEEL